MAKSLLKIESRKFRKSGLGIKTIAHKLNVSSSTVSLWCRDIKLSPEQIAVLEMNQKDPFYGRRLAYSLKQQNVRLEKEKIIKAGALKEIGFLSQRDLLIAGVSLYWAEGFKKDNMVGFANTDPEMIRFILKCLIDCFRIRIENIRLRVGINESHKNRTNIIEKHWSGLLDIPLSQFSKPFYQKVKWEKVYEHPENYFGTLRVRVLKSTDLLRRIKGMIEGIKFKNG
jgi:transcriptional regulator with XRE-family HTH domain